MKFIIYPIIFCFCFSFVFASTLLDLNFDNNYLDSSPANSLLVFYGDNCTFVPGHNGSACKGRPGEPDWFGDAYMEYYNPLFVLDNLTICFWANARYDEGSEGYFDFVMNENGAGYYEIQLYKTVLINGSNETDANMAGCGDSGCWSYSSNVYSLVNDSLWHYWCYVFANPPMLYMDGISRGFPNNNSGIINPYSTEGYIQVYVDRNMTVDDLLVYDTVRSQPDIEQSFNGSSNNSITNSTTASVDICSIHYVSYFLNSVFPVMLVLAWLVFMFMQVFNGNIRGIIQGIFALVFLILLSTSLLFPFFRSFGC